MNLTHFNLAICGHVKHGKSTLAGRLAYELGTIADKDLEALDSEAREKGKDYNKFNLIFLRKQTDIYERGSGRLSDQSRTVFPTRASMEVAGIRLTLVDTPGHEMFLNNIVYGLYLADKAIVVIDVTTGVNSGTERVCRILKAFETPIFAFCITKIDAVGAHLREEAYREVCSQISEQLTNKYDLHRNIPIVPVSALIGSGISGENESESWYSGDTLLKLIRRAAPKNNSLESMPLRFAIEGAREIFSPPGAGTVFVGTLEAGKLSAGDILLAEPASSAAGKLLQSRVRSIHLAKGVTDRSSGPVHEIAERAIISIALADWNPEQAREMFSKGGLLGSIDSRPSVAKTIEADIFFFEPDVVYAGKAYSLHPHVSQRIGRFEKIVGSEKIVNLDTDFYASDSGELVRAEIVFDQPCCIEQAADFPRLSRFVLRENNRIVGCGKCIRIIN